MGLHTGEPLVEEQSYVGLGVHRAARIGAVAHGGQVLLSNATRELVADEVGGVSIRELGSYRLKDIDLPERLFQLDIEGLQTDFPPLKAEKAAAPRSLRRRALLLAALAGVIAAAVAIPIFAFGQGGGGTTPHLSAVLPDSLAVVDSKTNDIVDQVPIPGGPSLVTAGRRFAWVASDASRTVSSISMAKHTVTHVVALNGTPSALAADGDSIWVLDGNRRLLQKIDPTYGAVTQRIKLPPGPPQPATNRRLSSLSVFSGEGALWVTNGSTRLLRIDPESGRILNALDVHEPLDDVAVGTGAVWAISGPAATVFQIDTHGQAVKARIRIVNRVGATAPFPVAVAVGEGAVWVLNGNTQTVARIDPQFGGVSATVPLGIGSNPNDLASGAGGVWVANGGNGTLTRIDPSTNAAATIPVGSSPAGIAVGAGRVWATVQPGFRVRVALPRGPSEAASGKSPDALPASFCSRVEFAGKGQPRYLIASDLPLQGRASLAETLQQADAIRFILAQHHFKAGSYSIGYQSCDDSISQTGNYDVGKCRANAQAYATDRSVIGIVGGYNSGCVLAQLSELNRAHGGPLAMISGNATYVGLTHAGPGTASGEPGKYYPRGTRSFVRVVAADDVQGAADAVLAKQLHVTNLYVLHDGDPYGFGIASNVKHAAAKLGISIVGFEQWDPHAPSYTGIARRIRRAGADGVFLGGDVDTANGAGVVKDLRPVLGERVRVLVPDGFTPISAFAQLAGPAAEGVTVSFPAAPPERLRSAGHRFVAQFEKAIDRPVEAYSVAWAQATGMLLDAIAKSDGSRASVTSNLLKGKVRKGILGSFSIDSNGDTTAGAVTIYRIVNGQPKVFRVITPPAGLVR